MTGTDERQKQGEGGHRPAAGSPAGRPCSEYLLRNDEIQEIFFRSGWHVCPFPPADRFMAEGMTTLGAWKSNYQRNGPCFEGSEPSFLVCIMSETIVDSDSALEKAHAVSWSLGHRILVVADRWSITIYDSSTSFMKDGRMDVLASTAYPGPARFENRICELLVSHAEAYENSQDFFSLTPGGLQGATLCPEALVSHVIKLADSLSRKIRSCEPGLSGETHEKLVTRLLLGILSLSILGEQYSANGKHSENPGQSDPASLHTTVIRGILEEMGGGTGEAVSADNILQITGLLQKEPYKPLILTLVPPRTFSYAFDYLSLIKSGKMKKKKSGWPYGEKSQKPLPEGRPRIPDDLVRYCTGRLSMLLNERKTEYTNFPVVLDPRCGCGQFLLYLGEGICKAFQGSLRETNTGPLEPGQDICFNATTKKEKILCSLCGLDPDPAKTDYARFVLFLWANRHTNDEIYLIRQAEAFFSGKHLLFRTIRNCQVLFAPELLTDLNRALLGPERAGKIHPFDLNREFKEIARLGGFDAITGNFIHSSHRLSRYIREYLQGHFVTYDPGADCSVYMLEKSVTLLKKRGICSAVHDCGWTGASFAGRLRNLISSLQIIEMTEVTQLPRENTQGQDSGILIFSKEPPSKDIIAAKVMSGHCSDIFRQVHLKQNRIEHPGRGTGGWKFRDPRPIHLKHVITRHGIPLEQYVMGELYQGVNKDSARFFLAAPDSCTVPESLQENQELIPFVTGETLCAYCPVTPIGILVVPPRHSAADKPGPGLPGSDGACNSGEGHYKYNIPDRKELKSIISRIRKYSEMKEKILIPTRRAWPACTFDQAGGVPDESVIFIPHRDLYLLAFLNSAIPEFLINQRTCDGSLTPDSVSLQWLNGLSVPVIDGSDEKESRLQDRILFLAERIIRLKAIGVQERDDRMAREIDSRVRIAADEINRCFYSIYGFSKDETDVIERFCRDCPGNQQ